MRPIHHYRDFPELFWDADPDAVIAADNEVVLSRVLRLGSMAAVRQLVDFDVLRARWDAIWLPDDVRYFWSRVLAHLPAGSPTEH